MGLLRLCKQDPMLHKTVQFNPPLAKMNRLWVTASLAAYTEPKPPYHIRDFLRTQIAGCSLW